MEPKQKGALVTQQPGPGTRGGGGFVRPRCSPEQPWLGSQKRRPPWRGAAGASRRDWGSNEGPGSIQVPKEGPQGQRGHLLATPSVTVRRGHRRLMRRGTEEHARAWRCTPGTRGVREHQDVPGDTSGRGVSPCSRGGGRRSPGRTFRLSYLRLSLQPLAKRLVRQPQSLSMSYVSSTFHPSAFHRPGPSPGLCVAGDPFLETQPHAEAENTRRMSVGWLRSARTRAGGPCTARPGCPWLTPHSLQAANDTV